ncbi:hypothetical protein SISSUDRAFT_991001, partial [Sistotremastrum suecicum HHB10207 ss-3]
YRCQDCFLAQLTCADCLVRTHVHSPLHRIQKWYDGHWTRSSLCVLGLTVRLGHHDLSPCSSPHRYDAPITVLHTNGFHDVSVVFCGCALHGSDLLKRNQLLRAGWFLATQDKPQTAFTFEVLELFHQVTSVSGFSAHQFHSALQNVTDNSGTTHVPKCYDDLGHCTRYYRHLQMLKRGARAHDPSGIAATPKGELALQCPVCPIPKVNLPPDWQACTEKLWLFTLFLAIDANFRLKLKDRGISKDPELGSGWAYFVEHQSYLEEIKKRQDVPLETSDCDSNHRAIERAHIKSHNGYTVTGVGAVICGRHGLIRPNGIGDLQVGERYVNMDYIFLSSIVNAAVGTILISYDIACQWSKNLTNRVKDFADTFAAHFFLFILIFVIPKFHLPAHGNKCQAPYSLNYREGCGRLDGEGIERGWAHLGLYSSSHKEKTAANRHDSMDDLIGSWNWRKIKEMAKSLLTKFNTAKAGYAKQTATFAAISEATTAAKVAEWTLMLSEWQKDPHTAPNPFEEPDDTESQEFVRRAVAQQEEIERMQGTMIEVDDVSPGTFLDRGINLEIQILKFNAKFAEDKPRPGSSLAGVFGERKTALLRKIAAWRQLQFSHMPGIQAIIGPDDAVTEDTDDLDLQPITLKLLLPSHLSRVPDPNSTRSDRDKCTSQNLCAKEESLRIGHCNAALTGLRRAIRVKINIFKAKEANVRGQRDGTRAGGVLAQYQEKISVAASIYRLSHSALQALNPGGSWVASLKPLRTEDCRGPQLQDQDDDHGTTAHRHRQRTLGEGQFHSSWIWSSGKDHSEAGDEAMMRVDWVKAYSRQKRWEEETLLLVEEMRRFLAYCDWKAGWWMQRSTKDVEYAQRTEVPREVRAGLDAYCEKQSRMWKTMAKQGAHLWSGTLHGYNVECPWIDKYLSEEERVTQEEVLATPGTEIEPEELD